MPRVGRSQIRRNRRKVVNNSKVQIAFMILIETLIAIGLAFLLVKFVVQTIKIQGESMEQTYMEGNTVLVNKIKYRFQDIKRFDVILFEKSKGEQQYSYVKRVVGMPKDKIQIEDGKLLVNGEALKGSFVYDSIQYAGIAADGITLEENEYFVLGDNYNNSEDSRAASVGIVTKEEIIGKITGKLW